MTLDRAMPVMLESGDRLTRAEFHPRYCLRTDIHRAELVKGVVYVASPVRLRYHGRQQHLVINWLGAYERRHPSVIASGDVTVLLADDSEPQPDAVLFKAGGNAWVTEDGYLAGAPELVVEIAASSASHDLHDKREAYEAAGVAEYLVWRVLDDAVDWFRLRAGQYEPLLPDARRVIESDVFPGLRLNVPRLLDLDLNAVLAEVERAGG